MSMDQVLCTDFIIT